MCEFLSYLYNEQSWILWMAAFLVIGVLMVVIDYFQNKNKPPKPKETRWHKELWG